MNSKMVLEHLKLFSRAENNDDEIENLATVYTIRIHRERYSKRWGLAV